MGRTSETVRAKWKNELAKVKKEQSEMKKTGGGKAKTINPFKEAVVNVIGTESPKCNGVTKGNI